MFVLRPAHMEAFARSCRETFEDDMTREISARFPSAIEDLGEEAVRERIRQGMERADRYAISTPADRARFIRFMFTLGPDFDTARRTRWAGAILEDTTVPASARLDRIRDEARRRRADERVG